MKDDEAELARRVKEGIEKEVAYTRLFLGSGDSRIPPSAVTARIPSTCSGDVRAAVPGIPAVCVPSASSSACPSSYNRPVPVVFTWDLKKLRTMAGCFTAIALFVGIVGEPLFTGDCLSAHPVGRFYLRAACVVPALWAALLLTWARKTQDTDFLARMTAEAPVGKTANDWDMPWNVAHTHLRYNARRMRTDAGLSLTIILIAIVIALLFYAFADTLSPYLHFLLTGEKQDQTKEQTWASLAARIAIGGLLIFLVQVLAGIYRYSIRMAAFYEGRAAALLIGKNEKDGISVGVLKELVDWLAGDKVKFDTGPKAPTELLAEVAKSVAESTAKALKKE